MILTGVNGLIGPTVMSTDAVKGKFTGRDSAYLGKLAKIALAKINKLKLAKRTVSGQNGALSVDVSYVPETA